MNIEAFKNEIQSLDVNTVIISEGGKEISQYEKNHGDRDQLHKVNSVTKSLLSLLIGIAKDNEQFPSIEQPVQSVLSNMSQKKILIKDLLMLSGGADPDYWRTFIKEEHSLNQLISSYTYSQSSRMRYNNIDSHILREILESSTKTDTYHYLKKNLLDPLDIKQAEWEKDHLGNRIGGYGIWLPPSDLSKIAILLLNEGKYDKKQLISASWIRESTAPSIDTPQPNQAYGYHWWISHEAGSQPEFYYAAGMGGNFMVIIPSLKRSIIICSSLNRKDSLKPFHLMLKHLLN